MGKQDGQGGVCGCRTSCMSSPSGTFLNSESFMAKLYETILVMGIKMVEYVTLHCEVSICCVNSLQIS